MADDMTTILAKLDEQTKEIEALKVQLDAKETEIKTLNDSITERDNNISKLQKIVSDNLIASREAPKNDNSDPKSFNEIYVEAIKNNMKKEQ